MKVTPIDIRHKEFRRSMRGYSEEEVDVFLDEVADDFELLFKENMELQDQIHRLKEQVAQYETLKETLQKTLISAQQQADETRANARKESELILRDAELKARDNIAESYTEKQKVQQSVAQLRQLEDDFRFKFKSLLEAHLNLLMEDEASEDRRRLRGTGKSSTDQADDTAAQQPEIEVLKTRAEEAAEAARPPANPISAAPAPAAPAPVAPAPVAPAPVGEGLAAAGRVPAATSAADPVGSATVKMSALDDSTLDVPPIAVPSATEASALPGASDPSPVSAEGRTADHQLPVQEAPVQQARVEQPPSWLNTPSVTADDIPSSARSSADRQVPARDVPTRIVRRPVAPDSPRVEAAGSARVNERFQPTQLGKRDVDDDLSDFDDFDFDFSLDEGEEKAGPSGRDANTGKRESSVRRFLFGPKNQARSNSEKEQGDDRDFDW